MESVANTARFSPRFRPEVVMPPLGRNTDLGRDSARFERFSKRPVNYRKSAKLHARNAGGSALCLSVRRLRRGRSIQAGEPVFATSAETSLGWRMGIRTLNVKRPNRDNIASVKG